MDATKVLFVILIFFIALTFVGAEDAHGKTANKEDPDHAANLPTQSSNPSNNNSITQEQQNITAQVGKKGIAQEEQSNVPEEQQGNAQKDEKGATPKKTEQTGTVKKSGSTTKWVFEEKNETCIIVQLHLKLYLTYTTKDNKTSTRNYNFEPNNESRVTGGSCGKIVQNITVQLDHISEMTFQFKANSSTFMLSAIIVNVTEKYNDTEENQIIVLSHANIDFITPMTKSYQCDRQEVLEFKSLKSNEIVAHGIISQVRLEAFRKGNNDEFASAKNCDSDNECEIHLSSLSAIFIICIVLGLIVIGVVGYIIGRNNDHVGSLFSKCK